MSHAHKGHIGAYAEIAQNAELQDKIKVEKVLCAFLEREAYEKYRLKEAEENLMRIEAVKASANTLGAEVVTVENGYVETLDEISVEVLRVPCYDPETIMTVNDTSVVYKLSYADSTSFLLAGDGETVTSNDLSALDDEKLSADVLFVPHHGKANLSPKVYSQIGAKKYIWQTPPYYWYGDKGDGLNSSGNLVRNRSIVFEQGTTLDDIVKVTYSDVSLKLPL